MRTSILQAQADVLDVEGDLGTIDRAAGQARGRGAELVLVPTALGTGFAAVSRIIVPARALESQVVIGYANHCGTETGLELGGRSVVAAARERVPHLKDRRPDLCGRWSGHSPA